MKIWSIRFANLLLAALLIFLHQFSLLYYVVFMHASLEFLNSRKLYLQHNYRLYNFLFWAYELVLLERLRHFKFGETAELLLNNAEHIMFGVTICLQLYMYAGILVWQQDGNRIKRLLATIVGFNIVGVVNEFFQNTQAGRPIFFLIEDSVKDIRMNLYGTCVFVLIALIRMQYLKSKEPVIAPH